MPNIYTFCAEMQVKSSSGSPKGQKVCECKQILVVKLYSAPIYIVRSYQSKKSP